VPTKSRTKGNNAYLPKRAIAYLPQKQRLIDQLDFASKAKLTFSETLTFCQPAQQIASAPGLT
jgi:hypothetical protein